MLLILILSQNKQQNIIIYLIIKFVFEFSGLEESASNYC